MSKDSVDTAVLKFIALSLLLHGAVLVGLYFLPEHQPEVKTEPYMVELTDLPALQALSRGEQTVRRYAERRQRVAQERAPRGDRERDRLGARSRAVSPAAIQPQAPIQRAPGDSGASVVAAKTPAGKPLPPLANLYPSASRLASLEEGYRKKYDTEIEEGETRFLNTEDIQFGSFLRRFETAVYAVWKYPAAAMRAGIHGVTPVKITFNRKGEIENIQMLQSSGSEILDREVFRALNALGPIGNFPRTYGKEQFNLIAFFEYGLSHGSIRGSIR